MNFAHNRLSITMMHISQILVNNSEPTNARHSVSVSHPASLYHLFLMVFLGGENHNI